jgi:trk system potassium uptake protein TrkA
MKVLVIGAGSFGSTVAMALARQNCEVIVIDIDAQKLNLVKNQVAQVIVGNSTNKELLEKFATKMDMVLVSLGEIIDASILTVLHLKELKIRKIIAKATTLEQEKVLKLIGAHQIVNPERDEALRLAKQLVSPNILDLMNFTEQLQIVEIVVPEFFFGKSLIDLDVRNKYEMQILAVRNPLTNLSVVMPRPEYLFQADDIMIVIGDTNRIEKLSPKL